VYWGNYSFVVNYFADSANCAQARAHLLLFDPASQEWFELNSANVGFTMAYPSPRVMDLSNPHTSQCDGSDILCYNNYSDWWVSDAEYQARSVGTGMFLNEGNLPIRGKKSQMVFRFGKGMRMFSR
jgi:hypothetical protein